MTQKAPILFTAELFQEFMAFVSARNGSTSLATPAKPPRKQLSGHAKRQLAKQRTEALRKVAAATVQPRDTYYDLTNTAFVNFLNGYREQEYSLSYYCRQNGINDSIKIKLGMLLETFVYDAKAQVWTANAMGQTIIKHRDGSRANKMRVSEIVTLLFRAPNYIMSNYRFPHAGKVRGVYSAWNADRGGFGMYSADLPQ